MKRKIDIISIISDFLIGVGYIFIINTYLAYTIFEEPPILYVLLFSGLIYLIVNILFSNRISSIISISILGLGALSVPFAFRHDTRTASALTRFVMNIIPLFNRIYWNETLREGEYLIWYAKILLIISITIFSLLFILFYKKRFSFLVVSLMTIAAAFFSYYLTANENRLLFAGFCTLSVLSYIRLISLRKKRHNILPENYSQGASALCAVPFAVCLIAITLIIPKDPDPIKWTWLNQTIDNVADFFKDLRDNIGSIDTEYFSLSDVGFYDKSTNKLGGPARLNNKVVFEVRAQRPAYLRGTAYHLYKWSTWTNNVPGYSRVGYDEMENDIGETLNTWKYIPIDDLFRDIDEDDRLILEKLSQGELQKVLFPKYSMEIELKNIKTRTVFTPLKTILPVWDSVRTPLETAQTFYGTLISTVKLEQGFTYSVDYYQPMYGDPLLKKALKYSYHGLYKDAFYKLSGFYTDIPEVITNLRGGLSGIDFIMNDSVSVLGDSEDIDPENEDYKKFTAASMLSHLIYRSENIYNTYTQLMSGLPERIRQLARDITEKADTDYEKVTAIEQYLKENYKYTLTPENVPDDMDLVDYFLFEGKEGYCTYFASAMTILLRTLGIPARYVEGYVLPSIPSENGKYIVTNKYGHAWVEVYFEGFGWLTFEPTPAYSGLTDYISESELKETMNYIDISGLTKLNKYYEPRIHDPGDISADVTEENKPNQVIWAAIVLGAVALLFLINFCAEVIGKNKIGKLKGGKKVMALFMNMVSWFSHISLNIRPGETVSEFAKRVDRLYCFESSSFKRIADIYIKVRYGNIEASQEETELVERFSAELKKKILSELGIKRFIPLRRIILGL